MVREVVFSPQSGRRRLFGAALIALCVPLVAAGCSSASSAWVDTVGQVTRDRLGRPTPAQAEPLDPKLEYMRATAARLTFLMVKGATINPTPSSPAIEVWYTPAGEVIRLREDGRLHSTAGIPQADWRDARLANAPSWQQAIARHAAGQPPLQYTRERDVMPGYHSGLRDVVTVRAIEPPARAVQAVAGGAATGALQWFQETSQLEEATRIGRTAQAPEFDPVHQPLPPALYAVDPRTGRVAYSEQCLSASVCISMQPWPPAAPASVSTSALAPAPSAP